MRPGERRPLTVEQEMRLEDLRAKHPATSFDVIDERADRVLIEWADLMGEGRLFILADGTLANALTS